MIYSCANGRALGEGSFGRVLLGRRNSDKLPVAVKIGVRTEFDSLALSH